MAKPTSARPHLTPTGRSKPAPSAGADIRSSARSGKPSNIAAAVGRPKQSAEKAPAQSKAVAPVSRTAKASATPARRAKVIAPPASKTPMVNKDALRSQVQALTATTDKLRVRLREATKAAKIAASRIADLEAQMARHEHDAAAKVAAPRSGRQGTRSGAGARSRRRDPGDAVPPGVAVEEPQPLDDEAETAKDNLEHHIARDPVGID